MTKPLGGLIPAVFTPFDDEGELALERVDAYVDFLLTEGVDGIFVCGSTGEGVSQTVPERKATAEAFARAVAGRVPLVVHVGHNALAAAADLAAHAAGLGAAAIAAAPPSYFKPGDAATACRCCAHIMAAAPDLPFYYYHIPVLTGVTFKGIDLLREAEKQVPGLAGIKFTHENTMDFQQCLRLADGRFRCLAGRDESYLSFLAVGATGAVGSSISYLAPLFRAVAQHFVAGDLEAARDWQARIAAIIELYYRYGGIAAAKAIQAVIGPDLGRCRLPLPRLSPALERELRGDLETLDLAGWRREATSLSE